jgi:hypothetical protein
MLVDCLISLQRPFTFTLMSWMHVFTHEALWSGGRINLSIALITLHGRFIGLKEHNGLA